MQSIKFNTILASMLFLMLTFSNNLIAHEGKTKEKEFVHGIVVKIDGKPYYFGGPEDNGDGSQDVPGHSWVKVGRHHYIGHHENTGPAIDPESWWSSDAGDGELLYVVEARIDSWSEVKAAKYYAQGFVHYHHLVSKKTKHPHPKKVAWLKHVAVKSFTFDGGPMHHDHTAYSVEPGVDFKLMPNWQMPYNPADHVHN